MATARLADTGLTPQMEVFAVFLSLGYNQTDAYKLAYPNQVKTSKQKSLTELASNLINDIKIASRVQALRNALAIELGMDDKRMLFEYKTILEADIRDYMTWDDDGVHLTPSSELTDQQAKAVAGVMEKVHDGGLKTVELTLHSRTKALTELAARLWPEIKRTEHKGDPLSANVTLNQLNVVINEATPEAIRGMQTAFALHGEERVLALLAAFMESDAVKALGDGKDAV